LIQFTGIDELIDYFRLAYRHDPEHQDLSASVASVFSPSAITLDRQTDTRRRTGTYLAVAGGSSKASVAS